MDRTREGEPMQRQKHGRIRERSRGSIKEARGTKKRGREGEESGDEEEEGGESR